jgi:hypothetical protein
MSGLRGNREKDRGKDRARGCAKAYGVEEKALGRVPMWRGCDIESLSPG